MSRSRRPVSRRTALGAALLGPVGLAACEVGGEEPARRPRPAATPPPGADVTLLAEVLTALDVAAGTVAAATARVPRLAGLLEPLGAMHEAHRAVLEEAADDERAEPDVPLVPRRPAAAVAAVRKQEQAYAAVLRKSLLVAESGDFARLLASMAAGVGMHLAGFEAEGAVA